MGRSISAWRVIADPVEECDVHVDESAVLVGDGDEIGERVERVFQLAARAQNHVEQHDIFDRRGELPSHLVRSLEQVHLRAGFDADVVHHERAESAAPALQRDGDHRGLRAARVCCVAAISARSRRIAAAGGASVSEVGMRRSCAR